MNKKELNIGIYQITNKINGNVYIGSACDSFNKRWSEHKSTLNNNKHRNSHLQNAWNKYGANNFSFIVLARCEDKNDILYVEQFFLDIYFDGGIKCYNICPTAGNTLGKKHSEATKKKMSKPKTAEHKAKIGKIHIGNTYRLGTKHSAETKNKISVSHIGKKFSNETRQKLSEIKTGKHRKPFSQEHKEKMRQAALARWSKKSGD